MKSIYLMLVALVAQMVVATEYPYKSSFYGCPEECSAEEDPKCSNYKHVPSDRMFAAIPTEYFDKYDEKFCGMSYVGMIIDSKADKSYKMIRATIVDQCGTCDRHQVDLSSKAFKMMADGNHGIVSMVYVFVNKSGKIVEGPIYSSDALERFASKQNVSKSDILGSFKKAASKLAINHGTGLKQYPWKSSEYVAGDHEEYEEHEEHEEHEKKTTKKKTTTTTTRKTTTKKTTTTTTTVKKTIPKPKITTTKAPKIVTTLAKTTTVAAVKSTPAVTIQPVKPIPKPVAKPVAKPVEKPAVKPKEKTEKTEKTEKSHEEEKKPEEKEKLIIDDEANEKKEDGSNLGAVGAIGAVGAAAGLGLLMLKRKSPEKYEDLKQKFPEAFGTVKRSLTRGASTIKRGVSRSVSRSGRNFRNEQTAPLPASYTFTLNTEDGLPRVALYDDPYPTKTHGTQHW